MHDILDGLVIHKIDLAHGADELIVPLSELRLVVSEWHDVLNDLELCDWLASGLCRLGSWIPPDIIDEVLQILNLGSNGFTGTLPAGIGNTSVSVLVMWKNKLVIRTQLQNARGHATHGGYPTRAHT